MEEEEPDFELLENPARVLPAQVCSCDFVQLLVWQKCQENKQQQAKLLDQDGDVLYKQHMESTLARSVHEKKPDRVIFILRAYSAENENSVDLTQFSDIARDVSSFSDNQ